MTGGPESDAWELFAVQYAASAARSGRDNFLSPHDAPDGPMPMDFYVWAARSRDRVVLVDGGADAATCRARGHVAVRSPTAGLDALGIRRDAITDIILTHLHWDHAGNLDQFPRARLHLHGAEMAHATGPAMVHPFLRRPYDAAQVSSVVRAVHDGRVRFVGDDEEIAPGLSVHHVGGHSPGLQVVRAWTRRGWVVLASDAMHYYANRDRGAPFPVLVDVREYLAAFDHIAALATSPDHVVPGHDPRVAAIYPRAEDGRGILRLDVDPGAPNALSPRSS